MSNLTKNTKLNAWLDEMIALTNPANVVLIDGTDEQAEALRAEACASGELFKLNQMKVRFSTRATSLTAVLCR